MQRLNVTHKGEKPAVQAKVGRAHPNGNVFSQMRTTQKGHARRASAAKGQKTRVMNKARSTAMAAAKRLGQHLRTA